MDFALALRRMFRTVREICQLFAGIHQGGTTWIRAILRGSAQENVQQRNAESTAELVGTSSDQIEETYNVTNHVYGW